MDFRKPRYQQLGSRPSKFSTTVCKKHPKHQQSPGVCSICLNEKLQQYLSSSSGSGSSCSRNRRTVDVASSSSSSLSSVSSPYTSNASSCSTPPTTIQWQTMSGPLILMRDNGKDVLTKSRSMAGVGRRSREGNNCRERDEEKKKKKRHFWSKLLHPRRSKAG